MLERRDSRDRPPRATQGFAHQLEDALDVRMVVTILCKAEKIYEYILPWVLLFPHLSWLTVSRLILESWECRRLKTLIFVASWAYPGF